VGRDSAIQIGVDTALKYNRDQAIKTNALVVKRNVIARPAGLEEPNALRWRAALRFGASLAARSAICAATALDVNGDHDASPVESHAAAEVSPPIPTASPRPVLLQ
jgi:hypothetical protein